jgi:photosystem II stability/assembly factor-like uncharacterized protein
VGSCRNDRTGAAAGARLAKEQAMLTADAAQQAQQAQHEAAEQMKKAAQEAAQKQRCDAARNRYAVFSAGGRIFKSDEQGNRVYYSDQGVDEQRVASRAAMARVRGPSSN